MLAHIEDDVHISTCFFADRLSCLLYYVMLWYGVLCHVMCIYIYIYIEREREIERERVYIYIYREREIEIY